MTENKIKYNSYENSFYINDDEGISQIIAPELIIEIINDYEKEIVKLKQKNKELEDFKHQIINLINVAIEDLKKTNEVSLFPKDPIIVLERLKKVIGND